MSLSCLKEKTQKAEIATSVVSNKYEYPASKDVGFFLRGFDMWYADTVSMHLIV